MLLVNRLMTNIFFCECALKIALTGRQFSAQNPVIIVWLPGSAWTRFSRPLAGFKGPTSKGKREKGKEGEGRRRMIGRKGEYVSLALEGMCALQMLTSSF